MNLGPLLLVLFERGFVPDMLADATPRQMRRWRNAVHSLSTSLGYPARCDDLTRWNCRRLLESMATAGKERDHIRRIRDRLNTLWKHAYRLDLAGPPAMPKLRKAPTVARRQPQVEGELAEFFEQSFSPAKLRGKGARYVLQFRRALRWLNRSLGRPAELTDLTAATLHAFEDFMRAGGLSQRHASSLARRMRMIRRFHTESVIESSEVNHDDVYLGT